MIFGKTDNLGIDRREIPKSGNEFYKKFIAQHVVNGKTLVAFPLIFKNKNKDFYHYHFYSSLYGTLNKDYRMEENGIRIEKKYKNAFY